MAQEGERTPRGLIGEAGSARLAERDQGGERDGSQPKRWRGPDGAEPCRPCRGLPLHPKCRRKSGKEYKQGSSTIRSLFVLMAMVPT